MLVVHVYAMTPVRRLPRYALYILKLIVPRPQSSGTNVLIHKHLTGGAPK